MESRIKLHDFLDDNQVNVIKEFRDLILEGSLPSNIIEAEKFSRLNLFIQSALKLQDVLYYLDQNYRFYKQESETIKANSINDNLSNNLSYTASASLINLEPSYVDSINYLDKVDSLKSLVWSYLIQCNNIIKLYQK
ncbi:MAG: hypothetical protein EKK61_00050 [Rickettsiales bacterium]|nr:MAG: hypothetical protein EKK61_00050 [Rickettsiales bacterium]